MHEAFVSYVWRCQYFERRNLATADGKPLQVLRTGLPNTDAGPDFSEACIRLGEQTWVGQVEIHVKTSDWLRHQHQQNRRYDNTILHVVWDNDLTEPLLRPDGTAIPLLVLRPLTDPLLLEKYAQLHHAAEPIPCAAQWQQVPDLAKMAMFDKALARRLERKAETVLALLKRNHDDWEETTWQLLAQNFGFKLNAEPFLALAQSLPMKLLRKHQDQPMAQEALLFGQAGWLNDPADEYLQQLAKEYDFLRHKYQLQPMAAHRWKLLRLRPAGFPTIRLAQLAALIGRQLHLFAGLTAEVPYKTLFETLQVRQSAYWQQHYLPAKPTSEALVGLGADGIHNLLINTVAPLLAAYAVYTDQTEPTERALRLLEHLPAENNQITRKWAQIGLKIKNAFDAQASIELFNEFCTPKKCLSCGIGAALLKNEGRKD
jgi:hypothetical protein